MNLIAWMKQKIGWIDKMIEIEQMGRIGMYVEPCEDEIDNLDNTNEIHRMGMQLLIYIL
jgi:hypothetical protein